MFLKNYWYVAAFADEIAREPLARTILGEPVVFYRTEAGEPVAFEDRCCHRHAPLSLGRLVGDNLQCGYHGLTYEPSGTVVAIPGQTTVPNGGMVRKYPLVDRWRFGWIWMGDPELANPDDIPEVRFNDHPDWSYVGGYLHMDCHYMLLVDNLMDLTHETFLHAKTIGNVHVAETPLAKVQPGSKEPLKISPLQDLVDTKNSITATRWMIDIEPPPLYAKSGGFEGRNVDRWQLLHFQPPSHVWLDAGVAAAGTGAPEGDRKEGITHILYDGITPETEDSLHYFWSFPRNYNIEDKALDDLLQTGISNTFLEDKEMLEGQHALMKARPDAPRIDINADAPAVQVRRVVDRLIREQAGTPSPDMVAAAE